MTVGRQMQPRLDEPSDVVSARRQDGRFEEPLGRLDAEIVADVEDVKDDRELDGAGATANVDVAEWGWMRCGRRRDTEQREQTQWTEALHLDRIGVNGNVRR